MVGKKKVDDQGKTESFSAKGPGCGGKPPKTNKTPGGYSLKTNKLYRTPRTPPPEKQFTREKGFILDGGAVSHIAADNSICNPKLGPAIPPYNAQRDPLTYRYFQFEGVGELLSKTDQVPPGNSLEGPIIDRFHEIGSGYQYIYRRNKHGGGHCMNEVAGRQLLGAEGKPFVNYNGSFGYRRNQPHLRNTPSEFGILSRYPIY